MDGHTGQEPLLGGWGGGCAEGRGQRAEGSIAGDPDLGFPTLDNG
jgi:hypothetical protein